MTLDEEIADFRKEILQYTTLMCDFHKTDDYKDNLSQLSAISARVTMMRNRVIRSSHNKAVRFRIDEVDPLIQEIDRQFQIYSRMHSIREFEWKVTQ